MRARLGGLFLLLGGLASLWFVTSEGFYTPLVKLWSKSTEARIIEYEFQEDMGPYKAWHIRYEYLVDEQPFAGQKYFESDHRPSEGAETIEIRYCPPLPHISDVAGYEDSLFVLIVYPIFTLVSVMGGFMLFERMQLKKMPRR